MTKRILFALVSAAVLTLVGAAPAVAAPLGLGQGASVGSAVGTVQPESVVDVAGDAVGTVAGTANHVVAAEPSSGGASSVFAGSEEVHAVPAGTYKAFENLVNDVQDGGGWHGDVVTTDAFSTGGVDGGVSGVSIPFPARIEASEM